MSKKDFTPKSLLKIMEEEEFASRIDNRGFLNKKTGSGVLVTENGDIDISSSKFTH